LRATTRKSTAQSVIGAFQRAARNRSTKEKKLSAAIQKLAQKWQLSKKAAYLLEKKLSRIPGHLRYLKHLQLAIIQQYPNLSLKEFWRAYNEGSLDDSQFSYPQSTKLDVTGEASWIGLDRRGRPIHPAAPLAGYIINKIESLAGKKVTFARAIDSRRRPPYGIEIDVVRCALTLNLYAIPIPSDETIAKWVREARTKPLKIPPDPPFAKSRSFWGSK